MPQCDTRSTTINAIMRSKVFRQGVADQRSGIWTDFRWVDEQWRYERGRQFAAACPSITLEDCKPVHGKVNRQLQVVFADLLAARTIL